MERKSHNLILHNILEWLKKLMTLEKQQVKNPIGLKVLLVECQLIQLGLIFLMITLLV